MKRTLAASLLFVLATACSSTTIGGEVDGDNIGGARSAVFDKFDILGTDVILMLVTDMPDGCAVLEDWADVRTGDCNDECEDLSRLGNEHLGREAYWWSGVFMNPYEEDVGTYAFDDEVDDDGEFAGFVSVMDFSDVYDEGTCIDECDAGNEPVATDEEDADGGSVTVDGFENNVEMKGSLELEFPGDETVSGRFKAEHCDLEGFLESLVF